LPWSFYPNDYTRAVCAKRATGISLLDLTESNPTVVGFSYPHEAIAAIYGSIEDLTYAPEPLGPARARNAVCDYYAARGVSITPDRIALTASTSEAYSVLFKLFCDPGDEILVPVPSYPLFEYLAALESIRVLNYHLRYDGSWHIDFEHLEQAITDRTRAIITVNPNNPTGSFVKLREGEQLVRIATDHGLPLISDEVFMDYTLMDRQPRRSLADFDSTLIFSLNGLSKLAAMPQMKLGWIAMNGPRAELEQVRARLELILDTYLSVGTPVQQAAADLLRIGETLQAEIKVRTRMNLDAAHRELASSAAHVLRAEGGWSAIIQLPRVFSEQEWVARLLEQAAVVVQPGYFFDMGTEAYIVVSLISDPVVFAEGIARIGQVLQKEC